MRICMIYYTFAGNTILWREAEALVERGHHVDIICLGRKEIGKKAEKDKLNIYQVQRRRFDEKGVIAYLWKYARFFVSTTFLVTLLHIRRPYNVIHVTSPPNLMVYASLFPKLLGAKVILDVHDIEPEFFMRKFGKSDYHAIIRIIKFIERMAVHFADHVITVTDIWRDKIIYRTGIPDPKCTVLMNVPSLKSLKAQRTNSNSGVFRLLYPGTLGEHFGAETIIKALPFLKERIPSIRLDIYGDGNQKEYLIRLTQQLGLAGSVRFRDLVSRDELFKIMQDVDLGVVPTKDGVFSGEALSGKSLEFLAVGTPIVITRTAASEYYYDESMVKFFEPGNPQDLAKAVHDLYRNPDKRKQMVEDAKKFNEKHNWEDYKKIYYRVIDNLCKRG